MARKPPKTVAQAKNASDASHYYSAGVQQPFLPDDGVRMVPVIPGAIGYRDIVYVAPGFELVVADVRYEQSTSILIAESAVIKFHYRLSGLGRAALEGDGPVDVPERCSMLLVHPDGVEKEEWFFAGQHEQSVTLLCSPDFLSQRLPDIVDQLPETIRLSLAGGADKPLQRMLPLRADMAHAAAALLACELSGSLRRLYAEARAYELFTLSIQTLIDTEAGLDRRDGGLTPKDGEKLRDARARLEKNFLEPPTIAELARSVDMNEAKLMRAFKQTFGSTIFDFTQRLRMERAKKLLETTELSVTEIAFEVGYEYSSNFTTAFKRHFGITPKAARDAANP